MNFLSIFQCLVFIFYFVIHLQFFLPKTTDKNLQCYQVMVNELNFSDIPVQKNYSSIPDIDIFQLKTDNHSKTYEEPTESQFMPTPTTVPFQTITELPSVIKPLKKSIISTHGGSLPDTKIMKVKEARLRRDHPEYFLPVFQNHTKQGFCPHCFICTGKKPCIPYTTEQENWEEPSRHEFSITLIMAISFGMSSLLSNSDNRLCFIPSFIRMWKGPFVAAVIVQKSSLKKTQAILKKANLPESYSFILYVVEYGSTYYSSFPINLLRNVAIRSIHTSHYLVMDADMRLSKNIYKELMALPAQIINDRKSAVIIPAVFIKKPRIILNKCSTLQQCEYRSMKIIPKTRDELIDCYNRSVCSFFKGHANSHLYISNQWIEAEEHQLFNLTCFPSRYQEPYLMLKYTKDTVLFDERFIDYGCNKVQYVDHIRFLGYSFYLPTSVFAVDIVHQPSQFSREFRVRYINQNRPNIYIVCYRYLEGLAKAYGMMDNVLPICKETLSVTYSQISL